MFNWLNRLFTKVADGKPAEPQRTTFQTYLQGTAYLMADKHQDIPGFVTNANTLMKSLLCEGMEGYEENQKRNPNTFMTPERYILMLCNSTRQDYNGHLDVQPVSDIDFKEGDAAALYKGLTEPLAKLAQESFIIRSLRSSERMSGRPVPKGQPQAPRPGA